MKKPLLLAVLLVLPALPVAALACDTCTTAFPSYLSEQYCSDLKRDFMTTDTQSLQRYRTTQLASKHPGGMNNIRKFLVQRQAWLQECNAYLNESKGRHLFKDETTTRAIFASMQSLNGELEALLQGVTYSTLNADTQVAADKIDRMLELIDDHDTLMRIKGQMVYR